MHVRMQIFYVPIIYWMAILMAVSSLGLIGCLSICDFISIRSVVCAVMSTIAARRVGLPTV
jgi:hypothetical protein